ncbi:hypothetical protein BH23ACT5_BH23ACT5_23570 [soil metagenome]
MSRRWAALLDSGVVPTEVDVYWSAMSDCLASASVAVTANAPNKRAEQLYSAMHSSGRQYADCQAQAESAVLAVRIRE